MPPASFVAATAGSAGVGDDFATFQIPAIAKPGDTLVAIVALDADDTGLDTDAVLELGWSELNDFGSPGSNLYAFRRELAQGEASGVAFELLGTLTNPGLAAMLVYRGLDNGAAVVGATGSVITASTNFVCPSRVLTSYSDLYLGIVLVDTAATAIAPPGGTTERLELQTTGRTLAVFDFLAEATGSTGTKTATTGANQSGIAAAIALAALPIVGFGKAFAFDPIGTIGLPSKGV